MFEKLSAVIGAMRRLGLSLRVVTLLFGLNLLATAFEAIGIAMLLPIFQLLSTGGTIDSSKLQGRPWHIIREVLTALHLPVALGALLGISFVFLCLRQIFSFFNVQSNSKAYRRLMNDVRRRIFVGFLRSETALQDDSRIGEFAGDMSVELERALSSIFSILRAAGVAAQAFVYIAALFALSASLTALSLALIVISAYFTRSLFSKIRRTGAAMTDANLQLTTFIVERLRHARLIRLSGTERGEADAFTALSRNHTDQSLRQQTASNLLALIPEPIAVGFSYLVLLIGVDVFNLNIERLGLFVVVMIRLLPIVRNIIMNYNVVLGRWPSVERVSAQLVKISQAREPRGGDLIFRELDREIRYRSVSFSYAGSVVPALTDVTVTLPAHRMTALVGPTGAGKSTFIDLLPRLRDPTKGEIEFDGVPITKFSTASLRAGIAFVPQQPQIFNISVAEHIRYGKEDATDAEVREAARLAGALEFIERLPDGFATLLGDGGRRLSGGQRQRLDIARALVRRAPILILDEPTSALDAEAEAAFRDALRSLRSQTKLTIIVIAHRFSTIADADQIVVLKQGRVNAAATHDELMSAGGWYADANRLQRGAIESGV